VVHRQNQEYSLQSTLGRNSLDYQMAKRTLQSGEKKKQLDRLEDLTARKVRQL
jgi:hypothetical protein